MTIQLKRNDTQDTIGYTITNPDGTPVDITGATVRFIMGSGRTLVTNAVASIVDAAQGEVEYTLAEEDTLLAGNHKAEFEVTFSNGKVKTYPTNGYIMVNIQPNIDKDLSTYVEDQIANRVSDLQVWKEQIQAQLDQFAIGDSGPELEQARVDGTGKTYTTLKERLDENDDSVNSLKSDMADKAKKRYVDIRETAAVPNDSTVDNSAILKAFFEQNDYVRIDGTYYTNAITVDRTGKPPLVVDGVCSLYAKDSGTAHVLRIENGQVLQSGKISIYAGSKATDGLYIGLGTSRSLFENVYVEKALRNNVFVEYVTNPRFKRLKSHMAGQRLTTTYTRTGENGSNTVLSVSGITSSIFDINGVHFIIINSVLYKVVAAYLNGATQTIEIYPSNPSLTTGSGKILVGSGCFTNATKLMIDDYDVTSCGVSLYTDANYGMTISHSVIQACPVAYAIGKTGLGSSQYADNVINAPWFETDTEYHIATSVSSGSGITVIEPFTTSSDFKLLTTFGGYPTLTVIKSGRIYEGYKTEKFILTSGTRTATVGKTLYLKSTSGTSQLEVTLTNTVTKKFVNSTGVTEIYVNNTNLRNINITPDAGYTIEGSSSPYLISDLKKGVIKLMLDANELNYDVFITKIL